MVRVHIAVIISFGQEPLPLSLYCALSLSKGDLDSPSRHG
jgi:hypothetical protein